MKNRLITLLTMGHTLDRVKDRTGAYSLRNVNKFPKLRPVARAAAAARPSASPAAPSAQPLLFAAAKAPAAELERRVEGTEGAMRQPSVAGRAVLCPPHDGSATLIPRPMPDGGQRTARPAIPDPPKADALPRAGFLQSAKLKLKAFLAAVVAFVPKSVARIRGGLRSPPADSRPRAQAELALEKVKVIRNDLSDADVVVVAVQPKSQDSRAPQAEAREPARNPWTRVTARWVKLKSPAEGARLASVAPQAPSAGPAQLAQMPP
jgi:hypothetical protein